VAEESQLATVVADLDDNYLKVMLLLAIRRAQSEEPRRSGFWHAIAVALAEEQEKRRGAAEFDRQALAGSPPAVDTAELQAVIEELQLEIRTVEAEMRESAGEMAIAGSDEG